MIILDLECWWIARNLQQCECAKLAKRQKPPFQASSQSFVIGKTKGSRAFANLRLEKSIPDAFPLCYNDNVLLPWQGFRKQIYTKDKKSVCPRFYILREMMWWSIFAGERFPSKAAAQNVTGGLEKWKQGGGRWQTSLGGKITIGGWQTSGGRGTVGRRKAASRKIATRRKKTSTKGK